MTKQQAEEVVKTFRDKVKGPYKLMEFTHKVQDTDCISLKIFASSAPDGLAIGGLQYTNYLHTDMRFVKLWIEHGEYLCDNYVIAKYLITQIPDARKRCENLDENGVCPLHNLHCGYPECEKY